MEKLFIKSFSKPFQKFSTHTPFSVIYNLLKMRESFSGYFPAGKVVFIKKARPSLRAKREYSTLISCFSTEFSTGVENDVKNSFKNHLFVWRFQCRTAREKLFRAWKTKTKNLWTTRKRNDIFFEKQEKESVFSTDIFRIIKDFSKKREYIPKKGKQ